MNSAEVDAFHILPLSIVPLRTEALGRARIIKNARLEGVIEMFAGEDTGSGQVAPHDLQRVFGLGRESKADQTIITALSALPTYDVYSLRPEFDRLGIAAVNDSQLRLSENKRREILPYMRPYVRPLVLALFGNEEEADSKYESISDIFYEKNQSVVSEKISKLSSIVGVTKKNIPEFLEEYADIYMSLAYYQHTLDRLLPKLREFLETLSEIKANESLSGSKLLVNACGMIEERLKLIAGDISIVLRAFKERTNDMWKNISVEQFQDMEGLLKTQFTSIGGGLCAITVKMDAWGEKFPNKNAGGILSRAEYVMTDMRQGLDRIEQIKLGT